MKCFKFYLSIRAQNSQISIMDVNDDNDAILTKALSGLSYELKVSVTIIANIFFLV